MVLTFCHESLQVGQELLPVGAQPVSPVLLEARLVKQGSSEIEENGFDHLDGSIRLDDRQVFADPCQLR